MVQNGNIYTADEGKWFIRKSDSFVMGESMDMGVEDSIENYDEIAYTQEEYNEFCEKCGIKLAEEVLPKNKSLKRK